ncbi:DUF3239 domain-containing protein [Corynebacterium poyangense]|uniref:DUF3239 domain-containing protein n=1 Tax=Corynebacterium poyangense TaxID=2684405 RepID=A0A7H0SMR0_9CORY|nr:DUF3239 domain-containing protein [Corynebacterium poyangense]MBZ8176340.1 DUF3239 domain-containing protein [Corynebacterium poyangense]QNQ89835.1 DUF3239 domain-containing protein [Corynebacterium poyangense]
MKVFSFPVNEKYARKHNELLRDTRRLQLSALFLALLLVVVGTAVAWYLSWTLMSWIVLGIFGILAVIFIIVAITIPSQVGSAQHLYDTYPLAPAIVAEVNPRDVVLLALVNTNVDPSKPPRWGLALRTCSNIEPHDRIFGTRVPTAAVSGRRTLTHQDHWDEITPMPIAWGTMDKDIIHRAIDAIPQDMWARLEKNKDKLPDVQQTKRNLLILS